MRGLCLLLMLMGSAVPACAAVSDMHLQVLSQPDQDIHLVKIKIIGGKGHGSGGGGPHSHYLLLNTGGNNNNRIFLNGGGLLLCNAC